VLGAWGWTGQSLLVQNIVPFKCSEARTSYSFWLSTVRRAGFDWSALPHIKRTLFFWLIHNVKYSGFCLVQNTVLFSGLQGEVWPSLPRREHCPSRRPPVWRWAPLWSRCRCLAVAFLPLPSPATPRAAHSQQWFTHENHWIKTAHSQQWLTHVSYDREINY